jgi:glutamyl-tRNA reductase
MITLQKVDFLDSPEERLRLTSYLKKNETPGIFLQTCNRVEFYSGKGFIPHDVTRHLFRLVSGLESFFVGETFIQGQVKNAYQQAASKYKLDSSLHQLFQWAFLTGKRVRTKTALSRGAMSHSQAVVEIIKADVEKYQNARFAFVGINKMNKTIMNFLKESLNSSFVLCNRNYEKALELEKSYHCQAFRLDHLANALKQSDIVISGTSAPHSIIRKEHISSDRTLAIFDLAVPSDVDIEVQNMAHIKYYGLSRIEQQVNGNKAVRVEEMLKAEVIIEDEINRFIRYQEKKNQARDIRIKKMQYEDQVNLQE